MHTLTQIQNFGFICVDSRQFVGRKSSRNLLLQYYEGAAYAGEHKVAALFT
jgi:hypothetical protein